MTRNTIFGYACMTVIGLTWQAIDVLSLAFAVSLAIE